MLQTVRTEKVDDKYGVICLVSMLPSWVMVYKLYKKVHFLQFCADLSKKFRSVEAIYIYASESSHCPLSECAMVCRGLSHRSWGISNWNIKKDAESAEILQNPSTSITNISKTVSHTIINNTIFWNCVTRPFRCIYVNCFNKLRFLAEVRTILQKMYFFRQFKDHNS